MVFFLRCQYIEGGNATINLLFWNRVAFLSSENATLELARIYSSQKFISFSYIYSLTAIC